MYYFLSVINSQHWQTLDHLKRQILHRYFIISPPPVKPGGTIGLHSVSQSVRQSVCLSVCPSHSFSAFFSYMLWHIELKFCIWLSFTVLQIKFECRYFPSIFVGVMPLFMPPDRMIGGILFLSCLSVCLFVCLFVCLSVVNFNLRYNFWTIRDRDFIFGMHTPLMTPFQVTPKSMTLWPWLWPWS